MLNVQVGVGCVTENLSDCCTEIHTCHNSSKLDIVVPRPGPTTGRDGGITVGNVINSNSKSIAAINMELTVSTVEPSVLAIRGNCRR